MSFRRIVAVVMPLLLCQVAVAQNGRKGGKVPDVMRFKRVAEPKEGAFTVLVPQGWQTAGGIVRVDPNRGGGSGNAIAAKCDFAVKRDAAGTAMLRLLPDTNFIDVRAMPVGQTGMFPPGSNYNGMTVYPVMNAASFLERVAFAYAHPGVRAPRVVERKALPSLVSEMKMMGKWIPILNQFRYDAAMVKFAYTEGGVNYTETMIGGIEDMSGLGAGMWSNKRTMMARAPANEADALAPIAFIVLNSIQLNHQWLAGELKGQMTRAGIAAETLRYIQQIDREITEHRRRTNAEINNDMYLTLTGQEDYVNPYTKEVERGSNEWKHRWVTPGGDEVYSNLDNWDPNTDPNSRRSDWKRTPVRKR